MKNIHITQILLAILMASSLMTTLAAPAWREGATYVVGAIVTYNGSDYRALALHIAYADAGWNPASTPSLWQPVTASPVTSVPPTPVTTTSPTRVPTTAPGNCSAAAWSSLTIYDINNQVSDKGHVYTAKWWTRGDVPSSNVGDGKPWIDNGTCGPVPTAAPVTQIKPTATPVTTVKPTTIPTVKPVTPTPVPPTNVPPTGAPSLAKHALIGYWHNFPNESGGAFPISQVSDDWDVIVVAFADNAGGGNVAFNLDNGAGGETQFIADIAAKRAKGKKVVLSLGGQNGSITLNTASDVTNFVNSLYGILTKYGFDGIDLDLESGSNVVTGAPIIDNLITGVKQLKAKIGPNFYLSMAPEHPYVQGGYASYGSYYGAYLPIIDGLRDELSIIHVQYYNNDGFTYAFNVYVNEGTVDALVGGSLMLIEGFKISYGTAGEFKGDGEFKGLRPDQVAFGVPSGIGAAGRGFVTAQVVSDALDCLTKLQNCGSIKPAKAYPDYRGVMTWSINWDKHDGGGFSRAAAAALKTLP